MEEAPVDQDQGFDPDLFSPEELEMMRDADGMVEDTKSEPDAAELQRQYTALARMVAEGGERERQLRTLVNDLTVLTCAGDQHRSYQEQTRTLARLVLASSERELQLQQCLEAVRNVALARNRNIL